MYDGSDFDETVEDLLVDLHDLDFDSVDCQIEEVEDEQRAVTIRIEESEGPNCYIEGQEGQRYFYVKCYYNLIPDLAGVLDSETVHEKRKNSSIEYEDEELAAYFPSDVELVRDQTEATVLEPGQADDDTTEDDAEDSHSENEAVKIWRDRIEAALDTVNDVSKEDNQEIVFNLVDIFSDVPVKFRVTPTARKGLDGIVVRERIFPYEDQFSIMSLDESLVQTRIPANMGQLFFQYVYDINVRQDETGSIRPSPPKRPSFPS